MFLLPAAIAVVGLAGFLAVARDPIRSGSTPTAVEFARALGNRSVVLVALSAFAAYALYLFLNTWLPTYGTEVLVAGLLLGLALLGGVPFADAMLLFLALVASAAFAALGLLGVLVPVTEPGRGGSTGTAAD
ncbi:MAG: hypothetical protein V5A62_08730 [Haloarculaceae archaeon]